MPPPQAPPLEITLDFIRPKGATTLSDFPWEEEDYHLRTKVDGKEDEGGSVHIPWHTPGFRQDLESLKETRPSTTTLERLGKSLQEFLVKTHWVSIVDKIESALRAMRPVHITIRSNADQMYYLPWELLPLSAGNRFVGLQDCLLQYECLPHTPLAKPQALKGRILFAYSNAGGQVPAEAHYEAILKACQKAGFTFDPAEDVLEEASRKSLEEKLGEETDRPISVIHLLCHGARVGDTAYGLALSSTKASSTADVLDATELRDLLFQSYRPHPLRLVTLCACHAGDAGTPAHLVGSVVRMLHRQNVPAVIASRMPLSCLGSVTLTEGLYGGLLSDHGNLRTALSNVRRELRKSKTRDWLSLQFYAREGDRAALYPFREPPPLPTQGTPKKELVLLCHEAFKKATVEPEDSDAPGLFQGRKPRLVEINQLRELKNREWKKYLKKEVLKMASDEGPLVSEFEKRGTDIIYYGFPYIPLAVLAGYLARNRPVHVLESISTSPDSARFTWESGPSSPHLPLELEATKRDSGSAARLRLSVSALVNLEDCQQVLPEENVRLDLHFKLEAQKQGSVRREEQLKAYVQGIKDALNQHVLGKGSSIQSIHIFAAIPVSLAFHLGDALTGPATWLPDCFIYNFGKDEQPRYKWRLELRAAAKSKPSVTIF